VPIAKTDWSLLSPAAGDVTGIGFQARVQLWNGQSQDQTLVNLEQEDGEQGTAAYIRKVAARIAVEHEALRQALVDLAGMLQEILSHGEEDGEPEEKKLSQATLLVHLALDAGVELFHTEDLDAYATIPVDEHQETWPLKVQGFRHWLSGLFFDQMEKAPGSQGMQDAIHQLAAIAVRKGPLHPVYTRLAEHAGAIYLDLANAQWQAVEVTASGWRIVETPPVKFRRAPGMLPLPTPVTGGSLAELRPFVNVGSEADWRLLVSWLLAAMRPTGPYAVLVAHGEQGSAKSTLVQILRALVDPNKAALRTTPRDERDLVIAAKNGWCIALDNLSHLPDWLSDALCRLATGSGFGTRTLYLNDEETLFAATRPIAINGIEELATRGDLLDWALLLYLPMIPEEQRRDAKAFWAAFEQASPRILGALLTIVAQTLNALPDVTLPRKPRMADFALWACAAAPACGWTKEQFLEAYAGVRESSHALTLEASPVGQVVRDFITHKGAWEGTGSGLLAELEALAGEKAAKQKAWPKNARVLSNALRRLAPTLRAVGIEVTMGERTGKARTRQIQLAVIGAPRDQGAV
jgi:hypothetical protein